MSLHLSQTNDCFKNMVMAVKRKLQNLQTLNCIFYFSVSYIIADVVKFKVCSLQAPVIGSPYRQVNQVLEPNLTPIPVMVVK